MPQGGTGNGIVLAQRLEQVAEPAGVCIQGSIYEAMSNRVAFEYRWLRRSQGCLRIAVSWPECLLPETVATHDINFYSVQSFMLCGAQSD